MNGRNPALSGVSFLHILIKTANRLSNLYDIEPSELVLSVTGLYAR